jgi:hypothetical protein
MIFCQQSSYFSLLKANNYIPSLSYSFNAGSYYRSSTVKNAFTSLIFGGYDASRFVSNDLTFQFAADNGRELVVGLQTITKSAGNSNTSLLPSGILAALDSSQPNIWLPLAACQDFEQAFGLTWNEDVELYLVNDTLHQLLLTEDPSVVFQIGNAVQGGDAIEISLPYGSFDLEVLPPLVNSSTRYFPLKRAANASQVDPTPNPPPISPKANKFQYTLGRAFLQEAYLTADYERGNFSVSQAIWNDTAPADIKPILSPSTTKTPAKSSKLSAGAIAGIVIGAVVLLLAVAAAVYFWRRKRQARSRAVELEAESAKANQTVPSEGGVPPTEDKKTAWAELDGIDGSRHEVSGAGLQPVEMEGGEGTPVELSGRNRVHELYGDDLGRYSELGSGS